MKKITIALVMMILLILSAGCQTLERYQSPQTAGWFEEPAPEGYEIAWREVAVLHQLSDKEDPAAYMPIGNAPALPELLVDLDEAEYYGVFIVSVRLVFQPIGSTETEPSGWIYSDVAEDVDVLRDENGIPVLDGNGDEQPVMFYVINGIFTKARALHIK